MRKMGMSLDRRQGARPSALVGDRVRLANPQGEVGVVVEKERSYMIVEDHEQDVRLLLRQPSANWFVSLEDRSPNWIVRFLAVQREPNSGRMRGSDSANDSCHTVI